MMRHESWSATWLLTSLSPYGGMGTIPQDHESWQAILRRADRGLVLPRLAIALQDRREQLPAGVHEHLQLTLDLNRLRNQQLQSQLLTLLQRLNSAGIAPVVMKGATALLDESADIGARIMFDMDIWTPGEEALDRTSACLQELGYAMRGELSDYARSQHLPPFFLHGSLSRVELHKHLVNPDHAALVSEEDAVAGLSESHFRGVRYMSLDPMTALRLSYSQCRRSCEDGHITMMKWLDFLDRLKGRAHGELLGPWEFGIRSDGDDIDARFFTGLSHYCALPYRGRRDDALIRAFEAAQYAPLWRRFTRNVIGNALDPRKWQEKTAAEIWKAVMFRVKNLHNSYAAARNRNRF